jgi:hypothetical protein
VLLVPVVLNNGVASQNGVRSVKKREIDLDCIASD